MHAMHASHAMHAFERRHVTDSIDYTYQATVLRWVDGDTVKLDVDLGFGLAAKHTFRLYGIDTPERGRAGYDEAKTLVNILAPPLSLVQIQTLKDADKYGRYLAILHVTDGCVNDILVEDGLAVPYFGGTKTPIAA